MREKKLASENKKEAFSFTSLLWQRGISAKKRIYL